MAGKTSFFSQRREVSELGCRILPIAQQDDAIPRQSDFPSRFPGIFDQGKLGGQSFGAAVLQLES
jgi:hypothetical protein